MNCMYPAAYKDRAITQIGIVGIAVGVSTPLLSGNSNHTSYVSSECLSESTHVCKSLSVFFCLCPPRLENTDRAGWAQRWSRFTARAMVTALVGFSEPLPIMPSMQLTESDSGRASILGLFVDFLHQRPARMYACTCMRHGTGALQDAWRN